MVNMVGMLILEVNIISILIATIVLVKSIIFSGMDSHKHFIFAIAMELAMFVSDAGFVASHHGILPHHPALLLAFKSIYFVMSVATAFSWFIYYEEQQGTIIARDKKVCGFASLLCWFMIYNVIANLFDHQMFYVDENGQFSRGQWYVIQYVFCFVYIYLTFRRGIAHGIKNRHTPEGREDIKYSFFPLIPGAAGLIQFFIPDAPLVNISIAFVTLIIYVNSLDVVISVDPLTQLMNRKQFMRTMSIWVNGRVREKSENVYFMIMDVDYFKHINDKYGHNEGDMALVRVAEALRSACLKQHKKATICRYGGDEFVLLVEAANMDEIGKLIHEIGRTLDEKGKEAGVPYKISVSIGAASLSEGKTAKAIIDIADKRLYDIKEAHHHALDEEDARKAGIG